MRLRKKRVALLAFALMLVVAMAGGYYHELQAHTKRQSVLNVYREFLSQPYVNWEGVDNYERLSSSRSDQLAFGLIDLNGDGCYELIVKNKAASYASGTMRLYTVDDGALIQLLSTESIKINSKTHIIACHDTHMGYYWGDYYALDHTGTLVNKASYEAAMTAILPAKEIIYAGRLDGVSVRYTSCRLNDQEVSYEAFAAGVDELVEGGRFYEEQLFDNSEEAREAHL